MIYKATEDNVIDILSMIEEYAMESKLPINFSYDHSKEIITKTVNSTNSFILVYETNFDYKGFLLGSIIHFFSEEKVLDISMLYVLQQHRKTLSGIGIKLVNEAINLAKSVGCEITLVGSSIMSSPDTEVKLNQALRSYDFKHLGEAFYREIKGE